MAVTFFWLRRLRSAIAQNNGMLLRNNLQLGKLKLSQGYGWVTCKTKNSSSTPILMHSAPPNSGLSELLDCTRARKTDFKFVMCEHKFLMSLGVCCNNLLEFLKLCECRRS